MTRTILKAFSLIILFFSPLIGYALAAENGTIHGHVTDSQTGDPLPGANVLIVGTSLGASTGLNGDFVIQSVPPGSYTVKTTYIGYKAYQTQVNVAEGADLKLDLKLEAVGVQGKEVVVTAQASGQNQAINQQLASNQIVSVVSAARIQELPDANAAESVGRLPGVSVLRSGGEADQVVIRGLAPQYNEIEINGVQMASSDPNNRSTDLSMISSNMLEGIQVTKTVTPDMDANVIGGVVNFSLPEARVDKPGVPKFEFLAQGAYNGLSGVYDKFRNYKYVASGENRFFDDRFGVFVQASYERRNLSDNELGATYGSYGVAFTDLTQYLAQNVTLDDIARDRQRGNGVVALDYKLPAGKILFSNFFSSGVTKTDDRQQYYNIGGGADNQSFTARRMSSTLNSVNNLLSYEQQAGIFHIKASLSHSYSETRDPNDWTVSFINSSAGIGNFGNLQNVNPQDIVRAANNDTSNALLSTVSSNYFFTRERDLGGAVDIEVPLNFSDEITSVIKFGGKYQHQTRSYNNNAIDGEPFGYASGGAIISNLQSAFPWFQTKPGDNLNVMMTPFMDRNYDYGEFLGGDYRMVYPLDFSRLQSMVDYMNAHQLPNNITYNYDIGGSLQNDYSGQEDISAVYAMATVDIGPMLTVIPGVRFQQLRTEYIALQGLRGPNPYNTYASQPDTVVAYHPYWFPDLLVRFKPTDWFDVRLAYTNTVSYPDYAALAPIIVVNLTGNNIQWNGFKLDPMTSRNYDAYFSFYNNTIGLFTAGAFLKQITNLIYQYTFKPNSIAQLAEYWPSWSSPSGLRIGPNVTEFVNNPYRVDNYGMELDWQTHFWYLPGPLTGLVLSANYTHIFSKAQYPTPFITNQRTGAYVDSSYYAPLLYQPDDIVNVTIGYDYKGFSVRVSNIYSAKIFTGPNVAPVLRSYTSAYDRWDIALKQDLPVQGLQVYCNLNNINGANDVSVISSPVAVPQSEQSYGYMAELGLRYQL